MPTTINESCIALWTDQLEDATNQLAVKSATFQKQMAAYTDISNWVNQLASCLENLEETDAKRVEILDLLNLFMPQAEGVCANIVCLKEGIEILYCDIFHLTTCVETLNGLTLKLKNDIDCLNNSMLTPESSAFVKCLTDLTTQVGVVLEMYQKMINQILDAANSIYKIECLLCNVDYGLLKRLSDLKGYFGGEVAEEYCHTDAHGETQGESSSDRGKTICSETLDTPHFPITDSDFYKDLEGSKQIATVQKESCKTALEEMTKEKDNLQACKDNLQKAVEEAKKARDVK